MVLHQSYSTSAFISCIIVICAA